MCVKNGPVQDAVHTLAFCGNPVGAGFELGNAIARVSMTVADAMPASLNILEAVRLKSCGKEEEKENWS